MSAHLMSTVTGSIPLAFDVKERNAPLLTTAGTAWAGLPFELHHIGSTADLAAVSPTDEECALLVMLSGSLDVVLLDSDGERRYRAEAGTVDLLGAGQQRKLAMHQLGGALHRLYEDWRTLGLRALAHLEAAIDFPDEDLPAEDAPPEDAPPEAGPPAAPANKERARLKS